MKKAILAGTLVLTALLAGACGPGTTIQPTADIPAARTSAAQTVIAELTLTAALFTPTVEASPTEAATNTPEITDTPGTVVVIVTNASGVPVEVSQTAIPCDSMALGNPVDVNIPDGSQMTPGQEFVKTWKIRNNGSCVWGEGYGLIYAGYANRMSGQPEPLATVVEVGQEVEVSVSFKAPSEKGEYVSAWQMANDKGIPFGPAVFVKILVK
jgi:hypothetical protein